MGLGDNQKSNYIHHSLSFKEGDKRFHSLSIFFFGKYAITQKAKVIKEERTECFDLRTKLIAVSCLLPTPLSVGTSAKLLFFSSSVLICKAGCGLVQSQQKHQCIVGSLCFYITHELSMPINVNYSYTLYKHNTCVIYI